MNTIRMDAYSVAPAWESYMFHCNDSSFPNMCVRTSPDYNIETIALQAARLNFAYVKPKDSRWSVANTGDARLKDLRLANFDMTISNYAPRPDRIVALPVVSTRLFYFTDAVLVNRQLSAKVEEVDWNRIFKPSLWAIVGLWRLGLLVMPEFKRSNEGRRGLLSMHLLCEIFGFYFERIFIESFLKAHVVRDQKPFLSIREAVAAAKRRECTIVFADVLPGWTKLHGIEPGDYEVAGSRQELIAKVSGQKNYIAIANSDLMWKLYKLNAEERANLYIYDFAQTWSPVAFCRNHFQDQRELVERAYQRINQAGLSYEYDGVGIKAVPTRRGEVKTVPFELLSGSFKKWMFFVVSVFLILGLERMLGTRRRFSYDLRLAEKTCRTQ